MAFPLATRALNELMTPTIWNADVVGNLNSGVPHLLVYKSADETVASSTVLQNDDVLLAALAANELWYFKFVLVTSDSGAGTGQMKIAFTWPTGATSGLCGVLIQTGGSTLFSDFFTSGSAVGIVPPVTNWRTFVVEGIVKCGGTAGNLQLQFAQQVSNASGCTMRQGSTLWGVKLA